jgi:hypothetical protein
MQILEFYFNSSEKKKERKRMQIEYAKNPNDHMIFAGK